MSVINSASLSLSPLYLSPSKFYSFCFFPTLSLVWCIRLHTDNSRQAYAIKSLLQICEMLVWSLRLWWSLSSSSRSRIFSPKMAIFGPVTPGQVLNFWTFYFRLRSCSLFRVFCEFFFLHFGSSNGDHDDDDDDHDLVTKWSRVRHCRFRFCLGSYL